MAYICMNIWALVVVAIYDVQALTDGFLEEPSDITISAGETVTLPCTIDRADYRSASVLYVYWYKSYGFSDTPSMPISSGRQLNSNVDERYSIAGSENEYHLRIENTAVGDTSKYMCKYYTGTYFSSQVARLEIFDESLVPQCRYQPNKSKIGTAVTIWCTPGPSDLRPTLTLWRGTHGHQISTVARRSDGRISYRFQLKANDNLRSYTCSNGRTYHNIHNCSVVPLMIASTISLSPSRNIGFLGGYVRFSCTANGIPEYTNYRWLLGSDSSVVRITETTGRYIYSTNGNSARLTIYQLQPSDNNTAVRCIALNDVGHRQVAHGQMIVYTPPTVTSSTPSHDVITTILTSVPTVSEHVSVSSAFPEVFRYVVTTTEEVPAHPTRWTLRENGTTELPWDGNGTVIPGPVESPQRGAMNVLLPILLAMIFLLIIIIIVLVVLIKKTGKSLPEFLERLWVCKLKRSGAFKRIPFKRPKFLGGGALDKRWRGAKRRMGALQNTLVARVGRSSVVTDGREDKRQSLREHPIEVVVNPPPPEWKFKVEDVTKLKRQRLISTHAPTGGYSDKERDLLNSLITGKVKMTTLDRVKGVDIAQPGSGEESPVTHAATEEEYEHSEEALELTEVSPVEQATPTRSQAVPQSQRDETKVAAIVANGIGDSSTGTEDGSIERRIVQDDDVIYDDVANVKREYDRSRKTKKNDIQREGSFVGEDVIYDNTNFDKENDRETAGSEEPDIDDPIGVGNYAELDLRITGPWDEDVVIQTEPKTAYAVIDHTMQNVESTIEL